LCILEFRMEQQPFAKKEKTLLSFFRKRDHHTSESTSTHSVQNQSSYHNVCI